MDDCGDGYIRGYLRVPICVNRVVTGVPRTPDWMDRRNRSRFGVMSVVIFNVDSVTPLVSTVTSLSCGFLVSVIVLRFL